MSFKINIVLSLLFILFSLNILATFSGSTSGSQEIADYNWSFKGYSVKDLLDERVGFGRNVTGGLEVRYTM